MSEWQETVQNEGEGMTSNILAILSARAPIEAKINQYHFGESRLFIMWRPKYALTFGAGQKKTSAMAQWHWLDGRHCIYFRKKVFAL